MGGKGSGGPRPGSGRKPKTALERAITGDPGHRGRLLTLPGAVPVPAAVERFGPPAGLTDDERAVWDELAPYAFENRTLVRATALAFRRLCKNIVLENQLGASAERGGPNHRGLIQRVDAELLRFALAPIGKPLYTAQSDAPSAANKLSRFVKQVGA